MPNLRIGLIGAGANTRLRHIPGLQAIDGVEVVTVANRSLESSRAVASDFNIPRVAATPAEVIDDPAVDAICIGTWPNAHREYAVAALNAGKHVLCEARMAMNDAEAEEMLAASRANPSLVAQIVPAPFDFRLGPTIARLVREGALGNPFEVTATMLNGAGVDPTLPAAWRHRRDLSGDNTMTLGIYHETIQRWLGDTTSVTAHARTHVASRTNPETGQPIPIEIPDSIGVLADMACGARATYHVSSVAQGAPAPGISIYGSKATLHWTMGDTASFTPHGSETKTLEPDPGSDRGWKVEADFVDSIRNGTPVALTSFEDGVRYMRFTSAAWRSWHEGRKVEVEPLA